MNLPEVEEIVREEIQKEKKNVLGKRDAISWDNLELSIELIALRVAKRILAKNNEELRQVEEIGK